MCVRQVNRQTIDTIDGLAARVATGSTVLRYTLADSDGHCSAEVWATIDGRQWVDVPDYHGLFNGPTEADVVTQIWKALVVHILDACPERRT